jgi:hypothetical protein
MVRHHAVTTQSPTRHGRARPGACHPVRHGTQPQAAALKEWTARAAPQDEVRCVLNLVDLAALTAKRISAAAHLTGTPPPVNDGRKLTL